MSRGLLDGEGVDGMLQHGRFGHRSDIGDGLG